MDEFSDNKLIYKTTPQDVVWSEIDDPNKWEVQEPYGYFRYDMRLDAWVQNREDTKGIAFYTAPPKREWVGLTEQDAHDAFNFTELVKQLSWEREPQEWCENFAAYCDAKLKEKNGG